MEVNPPQLAIRIDDRSAIGEARRVSCQIAERARIKEADRGRVPLIVTELATNLFLYAQNGEIVVGMLPAEAGPGVAISAIDHGPGITDVQRCLTDGYSTHGSRGCGLGAVQRLSSEFDIYSTRPGGTVVVSRVRERAPGCSGEPQFSVISVPLAGETECGDTWSIRWKGGWLAAVVIDGLGHGPHAATAAHEAARVFNQRPFDAPASYLDAAHHALQSSRGAAIAAADIDLGSHQLCYAGVGNIEGRIIDSTTGKSRSLVSHNGIIGGQHRKLQEFHYRWNENDLLVMHSDGISARWNLNRYPGLLRACTGIIAAILYRDGRRERDDAMVLVIRLTS
jgi:anti-sigma regulatory factor (Ser/Thr protein kinase)